MTNIWRISKNIASKTCAVGLFALTAFVYLGAPVSAQMSSAGGYAITHMESEVTVNADATLDVQERIEGEFYEPRHGLFRTIPIRYIADDGSHLSLPLSVLSVSRAGHAEPYSTSRSDGNVVIKIGEADRTFQGPFTYEIHYRVARAILFGEKIDEVYWNATGTGWDVPMSSVQATVHVAGVPQDQFQAICYTGQAESREQNCNLTAGDGSVVATAADFLTVAVRFPKGVVQKPSVWREAMWWLGDHWDRVFWLLPLLAVFFLFRQWKTSGKDAKGRGTIIPEYDPPGGLRPTEVGTLVDTRVDKRDLSAVFVDLAVRGYLRIVESEEKGLIFTSKVYTLEKQQTAQGLKSFERGIFDALFSKSDKKKMEQTDAVMAAAIGAAADRVYAGLADDGYYAANPKTTMMLYVGVGVTIGVLGWFGGLWMETQTGSMQGLAAVVTTGVLFAVMAPFMRKRTEKGALAREHALGFKLFLETAEKYRLQWQEREGIFEKFLPYAMAFGVTDKWVKAFEGMNLPAPTWYVGAYPGFMFNPGSFSRDVGSFAAAAAAVHAPSSKSGGGFGGGGFSGGGFGGGGGGSW